MIGERARHLVFAGDPQRRGAATAEPGHMGLAGQDFFAAVGHHRLVFDQAIGGDRHQGFVGQAFFVFEGDHRQVRVLRAHLLDDLGCLLELDGQIFAPAGDFALLRVFRLVVGDGGGKNAGSPAAFAQEGVHFGAVVSVGGGDVVGQMGRRQMAARTVHQHRVGTAVIQLAGDLHPHLAGEAGDDPPHAVDRHRGGATGDQDLLPTQGGAGGGAADFGHQHVVVRHVVFAVVLARRDHPHPHGDQPAQRFGEDRGVHGAVHGGRHQHGALATFEPAERGGERGGQGAVGNAVGHLVEGVVGRLWQEVGVEGRRVRKVFGVG